MNFRVWHDFNRKSEDLHETLRFKAKKVTPNQLFHGKLLFTKINVLVEKLDFHHKGEKVEFFGRKC